VQRFAMKSVYDKSTDNVPHFQLGHENSAALDTVFAFFYKCSLTISMLLERSELLAVSSETREQLALMYADFLTLVIEIAVRVYKIAHGKFHSDRSKLCCGACVYVLSWW
jgi:hypothetical protein